MGNGSPLLRGNVRAFALPFVAVAGLLGAPAAYAGGELGTVDPAAIAAAPVATVATVAATAVDTVQQTAPQAATAPVPVPVPAPVEAVSAVAATTVEQARETAAPVLATATHVVAIEPARQPTISSFTPTTPKRTHARTVAARPLDHTTRPHVRAFAPPRAAKSAGAHTVRVTVPRSSAARTPQLSGLAVGPPRGPTNTGGIDLSAGGAAGGGGSGTGLLLLVLAAAVFAWSAAACCRRLRPNLDALRPTPLLLHLERPD